MLGVVLGVSLKFLPKFEQWLHVTSLVAQMVKETYVRSLGWEDPLEKGMTAYSRIIAWRTPWAEEPGGYSPSDCKESNTTEQLTLSM